jgi:hypothetical protein
VTVLADLDRDERRLLLSSLDASAILVSSASLGRGEETVSEGFAVAEHILGSLGDHLDDPLVTSTIVAVQERIRREEPFPDYVALASKPGAHEEAAEILRATAALLAARVPVDEAEGFKRWLVRIAIVAAEAGKEDQGFLGRGGVAVNERERAAIREVAAILGVTDPA